jgi:hypothetical protein
MVIFNSYVKLPEGSMDFLWMEEILHHLRWLKAHTVAVGARTNSAKFSKEGVAVSDFLSKCAKRLRGRSALSQGRASEVLRKTSGVQADERHQCTGGTPVLDARLFSVLLKLAGLEPACRWCRISQPSTVLQMMGYSFMYAKKNRY